MKRSLLLFLFAPATLARVPVEPTDSAFCEKQFTKELLVKGVSDVCPEGSRFSKNENGVSCLSEDGSSVEIEGTFKSYCEQEMIAAKCRLIVEEEVARCGITMRHDEQEEISSELSEEQVTEIEEKLVESERISDTADEKLVEAEEQVEEATEELLEAKDKAEATIEKMEEIEELMESQESLQDSQNLMEDALDSK